MVRVLEDLADPSRRKILSELRSGPKRVSDLVGVTGLKQPNVSNHLAKLRSKGILEASKVGREVFYGFPDPSLAEAVGLALERFKPPEDCCDLQRAIEQYAAQAVRGDDASCTSAIDELLRKQVPLLRIYTEFLTPAMSLVGKWYTEGSINEAQEHLASCITERMMARAMSLRCPIRRCSSIAVLGCPPDNWHAIGLRMVSDYLRLLGWTTLFLGPNVPAASFVSTVLEHKPDLVLLSCATDQSVEAVIPLLHDLAKARGHSLNFRIGLGGRAVATRTNELTGAGADFVANGLNDFAHNVLPELEISS